MDFDWNDAEIFCAVASTGGFSRASEQLDLPKSRISRAIANFESRIGARLFERTTRKVHLTETGKALFENLNPLFGQLHEVLETNLSQRDEPRGVLRISTPFEFGVLKLHPIISDLLIKYPSLEVEIEMTTQVMHPIRDRFDVVFSFTDAQLQDSLLVARRVFSAKSVLCAAPNLVRKFGLPKHPADLAQWPCIADKEGAIWHFKHLTTHEEIDVKVSGRFRTTNATLRQSAVEQGLGAGILSESLCQEALQSRKLIPLIPSFETPQRLIYAFISTRKLLPSKVQVFFNALSKADFESI